MEVVYQGKIALNGSTKIICDSDYLSILFINIVNVDNNYTFNLKRYNNGVKDSLISLYQFELEAGDVIKDDSKYILNKGNYLQLLSNNAETTYYIIANKL